MFGGDPRRRCPEVLKKRQDKITETRDNPGEDEAESLFDERSYSSAVQFPPPDKVVRLREGKEGKRKGNAEKKYKKKERVMKKEG